MNVPFIAVNAISSKLRIKCFWVMHNIYQSNTYYIYLYWSMAFYHKLLTSDVIFGYSLQHLSIWYTLGFVSCMGQMKAMVRLILWSWNTKIKFSHTLFLMLGWIAGTRISDIWKSIVHKVIHGENDSTIAFFVYELLCKLGDSHAINVAKWLAMSSNEVYHMYNPCFWCNSARNQTPVWSYWTSKSW